MATTRDLPQTLADLVDRLGKIPLSRIRLKPPPGRATEKDLLRVLDRENRPCELVEGTLVEKAMGLRESWLAMRLGRLLDVFAEAQGLGVITGEGGTVRLVAGLVRIPDVAFFAWRHFPNRKLPSTPVPDLAPDLAVEVLSPGNTRAEMRRKLKEYFLAGVRLVWVVDPKTRTATVHTAPDQAQVIPESGTLDGGTVLPGFRLPLGDLFGPLEAPAAKPARPRRRKAE
jgi:Uma2 family endonuclease